MCTALVSLQRLVEKFGSLASTRVEHFRNEDMRPLIRPDQRFNPTASQQKFLFVKATAKRFFLLKQVPRLKFRHSGLLPEKKTVSMFPLYRWQRQTKGKNSTRGLLCKPLTSPKWPRPVPMSISQGRNPTAQASVGLMLICMYGPEKVVEVSHSHSEFTLTRGKLPWW